MKKGLMIAAAIFFLPLMLLAQDVIPTLPAIKRKAVDSTNLAAVGYDARAKVLEIEFRSGPVYRYFEVPRAVYRGLMRAQSKGTYFYEKIRYSYSVMRLKRA